MLVSAKNYWTKLLPMCMKRTCTIPTEFYYLLTHVKTLQNKIDTEVLQDYLSDSDNIKELVEEIVYVKAIAYRNIYFITSSYNTNEIEDIIKTVFKVTYINDEFVEVTRY